MTSALEQGLRIQPTEVSVKPPGGREGGEERPQALGHPASCLPWVPGPTSPSWGARGRGGGEGAEATAWCAAESGQVGDAGAKPGSHQHPGHSCPVLSCFWAATPLAWGSRQGGDRKGRGRTPWGTHFTFVLGQSREKLGGGGGGGDRTHLPHARH